MIYQLKVRKSGSEIYSHDILVQADHSFSDQVRSAMNTFRINFPDVSLMDDDVEFVISKQL